MKPAMSHDTYEERWKTVAVIDQKLDDDELDGMSLETRIAIIRNANLQYCIANHLV